MRKYAVGILGATGAVGQTMLKVLAERHFPISELRLLASSRSAGKKVMFEDQELTIMEAKEDAFNGLDIVLGAADNAVAKQFKDAIVNSGAIFIDNSSSFRLDEDVPLVVPEVNKDDVCLHHGVIANPNCVTIIALTAIQALHKEATIKRLIASTYQAVSGAGVGGIHELEEQTKALSNNEEIICKTFPYQIAYNVIPQIGGFNEEGYTSEEMKLQYEGRKILHAPDMLVNCTCVRIPVYTSHSESITMEFEKPITVERAKELISHAEGCKLVDNPEAKAYPMPLDTSNQDLVYVGRIRKDISSVNALTLFCCGDQLRKGAATNAIQIAEALIEKKVL